MDVVVGRLREESLPAADRIFRLAFGTFLGLPDPTTFGGDGDYVRSRWRTDPTAAFGAELDGDLVGSNFATRWGSVGLFGPLSVRPDLWDRGIARRLLEPIMERFAAWGTRHAGLFTFAQSPKHLALYQRFGFWPQFLTAVMLAPVVAPSRAPEVTRFSAIPEASREAWLSDARALTGAVFEGLDLAREVRGIADQRLGDSVLLYEGSEPAGLAVCHWGPGTEAGSDVCFVKFAAARPGSAVDGRFEHLLDACHALSAAAGVSRMLAGVNTGRHEAYRRMLARGFRTVLQGVAMHRPNEPGYDRPGVYVLDDWR